MQLIFDRLTNIGMEAIHLRATEINKCFVHFGVILIRSGDYECRRVLQIRNVIEMNDGNPTQKFVERRRNTLRNAEDVVQPSRLSQPFKENHSLTGVRITHHLVSFNDLYQMIQIVDIFDSHRLTSKNYLRSASVAKYSSV